MVLQERIELSTSPLPRECSTTELLQRYPERVLEKLAVDAIGHLAKQGEKTRGPAMSKADEKAIREQRLATKLRENLKRRKGQAKARSGGAGAAPNVAPGTKES